MQGEYWSSYLLPPPDLSRYQRGGIVEDVGCGQGSQLSALRQEGCQAVGLELSPHAAHACRTEGHPVTVGAAEKLPFRSESSQGTLCKVVLPYTDERLAIGELARVLVKGGVALIYVHGLGDSLRYLLKPDGPKVSLYGARTIINTIVYRLSGRRPPGFVGDTIFQSDARLRRYYRSVGLATESHVESKRFSGQPVFIAHVVRK